VKSKTVALLESHLGPQLADLVRQRGGRPLLASALAELPDLNRTLVASIGPVCSAALEQRGVKVVLEASPPKLGPLVAALDGALS